MFRQQVPSWSRGQDCLLIEPEFTKKLDHFLHEVTRFWFPEFEKYCLKCLRSQKFSKESYSASSSTASSWGMIVDHELRSSIITDQWWVGARDNLWPCHVIRSTFWTFKFPSQASTWSSRITSTVRESASFIDLFGSLVSTCLFSPVISKRHRWNTGWSSWRQVNSVAHHTRSKQKKKTNI